MRRLYLRIYVAMLASLAAFALLTAVLWRVGGELHEPPREVAALAGELAAELLPAHAGASGELAPRLQHWHERTGMDLALFTAEGTPIAGGAGRCRRRRPMPSAGRCGAGRRCSSRSCPMGAGW